MRIRSRPTIDVCLFGQTGREQQSLSKFDYSVMNSLAGEIRLLRVEKSFFRSDIVESSIIMTFLGQSQELQALYYHWGSSKIS